MTPSEILSMQPGRELDEQIAMTVFGVPYSQCFLCPRYSTSIADAWLVIEAMAAKGWEFEISGGCAGKKGCMFAKDDDSVAKYAEAETVPHAVCLAARLAREADHAAP